MSSRQHKIVTDEVAEQLRAATELLEAVVRDRSLLSGLTVEERTRLLSAAADVFNPNLVQRRQWAKAGRKQRKAARLDRDETVLAETGIRVLRQKPVFMTPNVFPPKGFEQQDVDEPELPRGRRAAELLRLQAGLPRHPPLLRPALPARAASSTSPSAPRPPTCAGGSRCSPAVGSRSATRRASSSCAPGRTWSSPRASRATRPSGTHARPTSTSGATGSRSSASTCGTRRASRRSATTWLEPRPARLHRQQRLPDRAPAAGVLPAHARGRARRGEGATRASARCSEASRGCAARSCCTPARPSSRRGAISFPRARSTRTCSRSTCATATRGG